MRRVRRLFPAPGCHAGQRVIAVHLTGLRQHLAVLCLLPGGSLAQLCARLMVWQHRLIACYTAIGICCLAYPVTLPAVYKVAWGCAGKRVAGCQRQHSGITAPQQSSCDHCNHSKPDDVQVGVRAGDAVRGPGTLRSNSSRPQPTFVYVTGAPRLVKRAQPCFSSHIRLTQLRCHASIPTAPVG